MAALLADFQDAFTGPDGKLGQTDWVRHRIDTGATPPIRQPPRRLPIHRREEAQRQVDQMLADGVIEPSHSPWSSPVVLVRKKDGTVRFCVDYRRVNAATLKDAYPIPRIEDNLDALEGARWFSTLDLASGYWQVRMAEEDKEKTAFGTQSGLYQFTVMPFGLCNAPATFERLMERLLRGLQWQVAVVYLDDVIVWGRTFEEHHQRLTTVLERFRTAGLKLKPKKCDLFRREVSFLGHLVSAVGVRTDPDKVAAIRGWPRPANVTQVRSFLGLASYYRRFIAHFAEIARPLHALTNKSPREFMWTEACQTAFEHLQDALATAPVLRYPDPERRYILDTDASNCTIGAVLSQEEEHGERVVA